MDNIYSLLTPEQKTEIARDLQINHFTDFLKTKSKIPRELHEQAIEIYTKTDGFHQAVQRWVESMGNLPTEADIKNARLCAESTEIPSDKQWVKNEVWTAAAAESWDLLNAGNNMGSRIVAAPMAETEEEREKLIEVGFVGIYE